MFNEKCFTEEWLQSFKEQAEHRRIDINILEKMIYALHLVEQLQQNGLKFTFKGGTSLVLLLEEGNRFSIDIDIISNTKKDELEAILNKIIESSRFTAFELQEHRISTSCYAERGNTFHSLAEMVNVAFIPGSRCFKLSIGMLNLKPFGVGVNLTFCSDSGFGCESK